MILINQLFTYKVMIIKQEKICNVICSRIMPSYGTLGEIKCTVLETTHHLITTKV